VKQLVTKAIILARTDFSEADRIITLLTPEVGKLKLVARGVRKNKSKLAGGIELFSISDITYMNGKGDLGTLISARLDKHYGTIIQDIERVQLGYDLIKLLNKTTEDHPESEYYHLLEQAFTALDDKTSSVELIRLWFESQLLQFAGHEPNLYTDAAGTKLEPVKAYSFDFDSMSFFDHPGGHFAASHIKTLRLLFGRHEIQALSQVQGIAVLLPDIAPLVRTMLTSYIRV
jgi:DNA repair protein RecO